MSKYSIGVDFGTLSGRAVAVDINSGEIAASASYDYRHSLIEGNMPDGTPLPKKTVLQHPQDYLDVLSETIKEILSIIEPRDVIGIGLDFTSCTSLPVNKQGTPLCFSSAFSANPHAYAKTWNHHAAKKYALQMTEKAKELYPTLLNKCGGQISSAWLFPKLLEIINEAPEVFDSMDYYIEIGDWLVWMLTGVQCRSACFAGFKANKNNDGSYPPSDFLCELSPKLKNASKTILNAPVKPVGTLAGRITAKASRFTGLMEGTAVAVANADIQACIPAIKVSKPGALIAAMGNSVSFMTIHDKELEIKGVSGIAEDGLLPGYTGYIAGPNAFGDMFYWYLTSNLPPDYHEEAKRQSRNLHSYLAQLMLKQKPGEAGILVLDWFKGNRSPVSDFELSSLILGCGIKTKPEEIYRGLIESSAFSSKKIMEMFMNSGIKINELRAFGAVAEKNPFIMQLFSDILNIPVYVSGTPQCPALGSAIFAAYAAGAYTSISEAAEIMGCLKPLHYVPNKSNNAVYEKIYRQYCRLFDIFSSDDSSIMKEMRKIRKEISPR